MSSNNQRQSGNAFSGPRAPVASAPASHMHQPRKTKMETPTKPRTNGPRRLLVNVARRYSSSINTHGSPPAEAP
jgi:hypothetical protein